MEQVDAFLDAVRDTFLGVRQPPLTAEEIRAKKFATTRLRPGYDEEEVDAFLEEVEARLRASCAECGAETAQVTAFCARCGAPVPERPQDEAPGTRPANQKAAKPYKAFLGWTVGILLNIVALWIAIGFAVTAISEGSPAQEGPSYVPLWACAFIAVVFSIVPAVSVVILVERRRKRRATASDSPELLPESLD
jgi:DivIVA domain-containing protein